MMEAYLASSPYIDWQHPKVLHLARQLAEENTEHEALAKACFEFVRDKIKHSRDYQLGPITIKASEVLEHGTGFCFAKSHILAALLRANAIPCALCYQRLSISGDRPPFSLHGLNAVYLVKHGWYRIDARGNKAGVNADFCPPKEQLAFSFSHQDEKDIEGLYSEPLDIVIQALKMAENIDDLAENLPDIK